MGPTGISLGVGTAMLAAIAVGVGVDFAVHTLDGLLRRTRSGASLEQACAELFPYVGRALLFNFAAVLLGFAVMTASIAPPLVRFGALVAVAVA